MIQGQIKGMFFGSPLFTDIFDLLVLIVTSSVFDTQRLRASCVRLLYNLRPIARIDIAIGVLEGRLPPLWTRLTIISRETPLSLRHLLNLLRTVRRVMQWFLCCVSISVRVAPRQSLVVQVQIEEGWCTIGPLLLQQDEELLSLEL